MSDLKEMRRKSGNADPLRLDQLPPHDSAAEQAVLGAILLAPSENMEDVVEKLAAGALAFYEVRHQVVYEAMIDLYRDRKPLDLITVQALLKDRGQLDAIGGFGYLAELPDHAGTAGHLGGYLTIVWEKFLLRRMGRVCSEAVDRIMSCDGDPQDLLASIERDVNAAAEMRLVSSERNVKEVIQDVVENVVEKYRRGIKFQLGPTTPFNFLNNIYPGLEPGQLIVLAARPGAGKTAFVLQLAEHIAEKEKSFHETEVDGVTTSEARAYPVHVFSLEMTARGLGTRQVFQRAGVDLVKFKNGFLTEEDVPKLVRSAGGLCALEKKLFIDDTSDMTIEDLEVKMRRSVRRHGVRVFIIDYFQLLSMRKVRQGMNTNELLGTISKRLKIIAKELNVPIVLLAQMNREIEKEVHRRPRLSDLRDTGQLEQDADVVMFLWKPDVSAESWEKRLQEILRRMPAEVPPDWREMDGYKRNLAIVTCTVAKQREGASNEDALLVFIKPWTRFVDAYRAPKKEVEE